MNLIQIKIEKDNSTAAYIRIIRGFDSSLSIGSIRQSIEKNDFVIAFDLEYYDVLEDLNGFDRKKAFRDMIGELYQAGAQVTVYEDGELSSIELLDNRLETLDKIRQQTELDIDRETAPL